MSVKSHPGVPPPAAPDPSTPAPPTRTGDQFKPRTKASTDRIRALGRSGRPVALPNAAPPAPPNPELAKELSAALAGGARPKPLAARPEPEAPPPPSVMPAGRRPVGPAAAGADPWARTPGYDPEIHKEPQWDRGMSRQDAVREAESHPDPSTGGQVKVRLVAHGASAEAQRVAANAAIHAAMYAKNYDGYLRTVELEVEGTTYTMTVRRHREVVTVELD